MFEALIDFIVASLPVGVVQIVLGVLLVVYVIVLISYQ